MFCFFTFISCKTFSQDFYQKNWNYADDYPAILVYDKIKKLQVKSVIVQSKSFYTGNNDTTYKFLWEERYSKTGKIIYAFYPTNWSDTHYGMNKEEFTYDTNDSLTMLKTYYGTIERKKYPPEKLDLKPSSTTKYAYKKNKLIVSREPSKKKTIYYYDEQKNIIKEIHGKTTTIHKYENGKEILRAGKSWKGEFFYTNTGKIKLIKGYSNNTLNDSTYYKYNKYDSLIETGTWHAQKNLYADYVKKYIYDDNGKIRYVRETWVSGKNNWEHLMEEYKYSEKDKLKERTIYRYSSRDTNEITKLIYSDTGFVEYKYQFDYSSDKKYTRSRNYKCNYYNPNGLPLKKQEIFVALNGSTRIEREITYKYDNNNNLTEIQEKRDFGDIRTRVIAYDSNQLPVLITWKYKSYDGKFISDSYSKYTYEYY